MKKRPLSAVIPTYGREQVLLDSLAALRETDAVPAEILVVDQTRTHEPETSASLGRLHEDGAIRWLRLPHPSIPHAMNEGLLRASEEVVLFLDDDILPHPGLVDAHLGAHEDPEVSLVAGRVLQPWDGDSRIEEKGGGSFRFSSATGQWVTEFMGGNFSVKRKLALEIGGFDENFVRAAYRYEADFADRVHAAGGKILFVPEATIRHLKAPSGGTRVFGDHLRTCLPGHSVGAYYSYLKRHCVKSILTRPFRAIRSKHHLQRPWWIPFTLVGELLGLVWAAAMLLRGPRYVGRKEEL